MFEDKHVKDKTYFKDKDHCHYTDEYIGATHSICNLGYSIPREITVIFQDASNSDYHFIIKNHQKH